MIVIVSEHFDPGKKIRAFEFAAINPGLWGKKYRFAYGLGFPTGYLVIIMNTAIVTIINITTIIKTIINPHLFCFAYNIGFPMGYLVIIINTALIMKKKAHSHYYPVRKHPQA